MQRFQKFMFDNAIFDDPPDKKGGVEIVSEPETPTPPRPPTYTAEQVLAARRDAWRAGLDAGITLSREGIDYQQTLALNHLAMVADQWIAFESSRVAAQERETIDIALALAQKFFPVLAEQANFDMIRSAVIRHLTEHPWQPTLNITVPSGTREKLKADLDAVLHSRGLDTRCQIIEDGALAPTQCHIGWGDGGKQQSIDRIWPVLERISAEVLAGRRPQETPDTQASLIQAPLLPPALACFVPPDMPPPDDTIPPDINSLPEWMTPYDHEQALMQANGSPPTAEATQPVFQQLDDMPATTIDDEHTAAAPDDQPLHTLEENQA